MSGSTAAGALIDRPDPIYPADAKARHVEGLVVMRAVIGTDGHVHALKIASAADPMLAISAIAAVRRWRYRPFLLLGEPTEVDTTITVNYTFGP